MPCRIIRFEPKHLPGIDHFQAAGTVNCLNTQAFIRITEFRHLTDQTGADTLIMRESPQAGGEPYYPVPRPDNKALHQRHAALIEAEAGLSFVGRLAQYRYYNMDQVVAAALKLGDDLLACADPR